MTSHCPGSGSFRSCVNPSTVRKDLFGLFREGDSATAWCDADGGVAPTCLEQKISQRGNPSNDGLLSPLLWGWMSKERTRGAFGKDSHTDKNPTTIGQMLTTKRLLVDHMRDNAFTPCHPKLHCLAVHSLILYDITIMTGNLTNEQELSWVLICEDRTRCVGVNCVQNVVANNEDERFNTFINDSATYS